jgi:hypothetical protein
MARRIRGVAASFGRDYQLPPRYFHPGIHPQRIFVETAVDWGR